MLKASRIVLIVLGLCTLAFAPLYVPRLANPLWSDTEFTGWVSPIAHRMAQGQVIYRDFTLPLPPGSFAVLALVQRLLGRYLLMDELWLCALCQMGMLVAGYFLVRKFTSARNAALVTAATAPILISAAKEIAYDHTALLLTWSALAVLGHALTDASDRSRPRWLFGAGFLAAFTLAFKSSTGVGAVASVGLALLVLTAVAWRTQGKAALAGFARHWLATGAGLAAGAAATLMLVVALGSPVREFLTVVFVDGPVLKGGSGKLLSNLLSYAIVQAPAPVSLLVGLTLAFVFVRLVGTPTALQVSPDAPGVDSGERGAAGALFAGLVSGLVVLVYAVAAALLLARAGRMPVLLQAAGALGTVVPTFGLVALMLLVFANLRGAQRGLDRRAVFAALALAAGAVSLMHNLSLPTLRPLYDNNPVIPLAVLSLLLVADQARAPALKYVLFAVMMLGLFGAKLQRYVDARHPSGDEGFWRGMSVSANGIELLRAATRVRELAGPTGTVLMLPEDPTFEALVGRPRPALRGAIVFVNQFPARLLDADLAELRENPPDVVVIHPRDAGDWQRVFALWSTRSPAGQVVDAVGKGLSSGYRRDSSYKTWMFRGPGVLDVYQRSPAPR